MNENTNDTNVPERGYQPSRRTMLKAAAWSVPVVVVAQASPAMAQIVETPSSPVIIDFGGSTACKIPGDSWKDLCYEKGYVLWASFINTLPGPVTVDVTGITVGGIVQCLVGQSIPVNGCSDLVNAVVLPAGQTVVIGIFSNASTDSSSNEVTVSFEYTPFGASTKSTTQTGTVIGGSWTKGVASCTFPPGCDSKKNVPPTVVGTGCEFGCT